MTTTIYQVDGMTCGHCVQHVTTELMAIDGVTDVQIDLNAGGVSDVTVASNDALPQEVVAGAIDEAGYTLIPA